MTRRWLAIAGKDVDDARRSRTLWTITGAYALLIALVVVVPGVFSDDFPAALSVWLISTPAGWIVSLLALVASYLAIAGERESGTIRLLLGLPPTRRDVVLGKLVGRLAVVLSAVLAAFLTGGILMLVVYGDLPVGPYVTLTFLTCLLAASFVGIAVGFSAAASSRSGAMSMAIGLYLLLAVLWDMFVQALPIAVDWIFSVDLSSEVVSFVRVLSPTSAYGRLVQTLVNPDLMAGVVGDTGFDISTTEALSAPVYLQDPAIVGIMLAWVVVPVLLGYLRFETTDLS